MCYRIQNKIELNAFKFKQIDFVNKQAEQQTQLVILYTNPFQLLI